MNFILGQELAEFVGIVLGDGSINNYTSKHNNQQRLKITFHAKQVAYQLYVQQLTEQVTGIRGNLVKRKGELTVDLLIFNKSLIMRLLDFGLKSSPKWNRATIPVVLMKKKYAASILRGYFDTDGSVVLANNNGVLYPRLEMKISPSPMQYQLKQLLDCLGFQYGCYTIGKGKVRIQMNGASALKKWENKIGFSNEYYSQRANYYWQNSNKRLS